MNKKQLVVVHTILILLLFIFASAKNNADSIQCPRVFTEDGNLYYSEDDKGRLQLTDSGRDQEPALHPDGKWVYFVRSFEGHFVDEQFYPIEGKEPKDGMLKEELWRINVDGSNSKMLYQNTTAAIDHSSGYAYASLGNIQMSPKGDRIYFETAQWVTSAALHVMDPDGSNEKMLGGGNETKIILSTRIDSDKYEGYIVTNQHRHYLFGGSYNWYWLYDPDWNEIGPLGPDMDYFTGTWGIKYTDEGIPEREDKH